MLSMSRFLDVHSMTNVSESTIRKLQGAPPDEFGVKQLNVLYNGQLISAFTFLKLQAESQLKSIMKSTMSSVTGLQRYKPLFRNLN